MSAERPWSLAARVAAAALVGGLLAFLLLPLVVVAAHRWGPATGRTCRFRRRGCRCTGTSTVPARLLAGGRCEPRGRGRHRPRKRRHRHPRPRLASSARASAARHRRAAAARAPADPLRGHRHRLPADLLPARRSHRAPAARLLPRPHPGARVPRDALRHRIDRGRARPLQSAPRGGRGQPRRRPLACIPARDAADHPARASTAGRSMPSSSRSARCPSPCSLVVPGARRSPSRCSPPCSSISVRHCWPSRRSCCSSPLPC